MKTYTTENEKTELGAKIRKLINIYIDEIKDNEIVSTTFIQEFLASKDEFKKYFDIEDDEIVGWDCEIMDDYDYFKILSDIRASFQNYFINTLKSHYDKKSDMELFRMFGGRLGIDDFMSYNEVIHYKRFDVNRPDFDDIFNSWEKYLKENFNPEKYIINE